ncbi:hypothetical protein [Marinobacterium sp. BA1]|uniref:hypothetical protein n=1 Tax=Marinobacterium sp. BA1 TaxID=3138931 RepID=UPI0032E60A6B
MKLLDALQMVAGSEYEMAVNHTGGGWFDGACWHLAAAVHEVMRLTGREAELCHVSRNECSPDHAIVRFRDPGFSKALYIDADGIQTQRQMLEKMRSEGGSQGPWTIYSDHRWLTPEVEQSPLTERLKQALYEKLNLTFYHVTPVENVPSILEHGLVPTIGPRSEELGEPHSTTFAFVDRQACETALGSWLGDEFEDVPEDGLAILQIKSDIRPSSSDAGYEVLFTQPVPAECFQVLGEDFRPLPEYAQALTVDPLAAGVAHNQEAALR